MRKCWSSWTMAARVIVWPLNRASLANRSTNSLCATGQPIWRGALIGSRGIDRRARCCCVWPWKVSAATRVRLTLGFWRRARAPFPKFVIPLAPPSLSAMLPRQNAMPALAALLIAAGVPAEAASPPPADAVGVVRDGRRIELPEATREDIVRRVRELIAGCGMNSRDHRDTLRDDPAAAWKLVEGQSHLYVYFVQPFENTGWWGESLTVSEVLIGFDGEWFIGPELSRHDGVPVLHAKCSGGQALELMCLPALATARAGQTQNCRLLEQRRREAGAPR